MHTSVYTSKINSSSHILYDWHMNLGSLSRWMPPWIDIQVQESNDFSQEMAETHIQMHKWGLPLSWHIRREECVKGVSFCDRQLQGSFKKWIHRCFLKDQGDLKSIIEDRIEYATSRCSIPSLICDRWIKREIDRVFKYRHEIILRDIEHHLRVGFPGRKKIVIAGASGLIGSSLKSFLESGGNQVICLHRDPTRKEGVFWDPLAQKIDKKALEESDAFINLCGHNIAGGRWTDSYKKRMIESRVLPTAFLSTLIRQMDHPPKVFISSSAIGYYGVQSGDIDETCGPGAGFLAYLCKRWEEASLEAQSEKTRVVRLRIGIVLTPKGGALKQMLLPFSLGLGGSLGQGDQPMSWIALDDLLCQMHHLIVDPEAEGPYNATAPHPVTNKEFTHTLAQVLQRPAVLPVPAAAIRLILGQMAQELLLQGAHVVPEKMNKRGYSFRYPTLKECLQFSLGR